MEYIEVCLLFQGKSLQLRRRSYHGEQPEKRFLVVLLLDDGATAGSEHATLEEAVREFHRTCEGIGEGGETE